MKHLLFMLFLLPLSISAQTKTDYENAIGRFQKFYNAGRADSISYMFSELWGKEHIPEMWKQESQDRIMKNNGKMISYQYLGMAKEDSVIVFKTVFDKSVHAMSLTLEKDNKLGTFRFNTTSDEIEEMLKKAK